MYYKINGQSLQIDPPILSISVNNNNVVYADSRGKKHIELNNSAQRNQFLNWLLDVGNDDL